MTEPVVKQKKVADFSKMIGREQISSLRKGMNMNKILMNKEVSQMHSSPRKLQSALKTARLSTTHEQFNSTQESWTANVDPSRLRSAKVCGQMDKKTAINKKIINSEKFNSPKKSFRNLITLKSGQQHKHAFSDASLLQTDESKIEANFRQLQSTPSPCKTAARYSKKYRADGGGSRSMYK